MASRTEPPRRIDLHCHVLPGLDDGCGTPKESAGLLAESRKQGIEGIAATPHYYPVESVEQFLERRRRAWERLTEYLSGNGQEVPAVCLGAEVAYRTHIAREPLLDQLCYGRSRYLLLEMPFEPWSSAVLREVREICYVRGLVPVIAHIERYLRFQDRAALAELYGMDVLIQMNAEAVLNRWTQGRARRMLSGGRVHVLGSDSHNNVSRPQNLGLAIRKLERMGLTGELETVCGTGEEIFTAALTGQ